MRKCSLWGTSLLGLILLWSCEKIVVPQTSDGDDDAEIVDAGDDDSDEVAGSDDTSSDVGGDDEPETKPDDSSDSETGDTDSTDDADVPSTPDDGEEPDDGETGGSVDVDDDSSVDDAFHEGWEDDPYTFRDLNESYVYDMVMHDGATIHDSWVVGYIVGYIDGNKLTESTAIFSYGDIETNILLADVPDVADYSKCIPVQLSKSGSYADVRAALNLKYNKDVIGQKVKIRGAVTKYMGVPGLKNAIKYTFVK